ncbi:MAG: hypothetical protein OSA08_12375 [Arenicellales bacterium]|nr:hypothetical protein [Arenicellales bacterium]
MNRKTKRWLRKHRLSRPDAIGRITSALPLWGGASSWEEPRHAGLFFA